MNKKYVDCIYVKRNIRLRNNCKTSKSFLFWRQKKLDVMFGKTNMTLVRIKVISLSIYNVNQKVCTLSIHRYLCANVIYFFLLYSLLVVEPHLMWIEVNVAGNIWIFYHIYASCIFHKSPQKKKCFPWIKI